MTEKRISVMPFNLGVCGVVYSKVTPSYLHIFCGFYWCSPELSHLRNLTGVSFDAIFSKRLPYFLVAVALFD